MAGKKLARGFAWPVPIRKVHTPRAPTVLARGRLERGYSADFQYGSEWERGTLDSKTGEGAEICATGAAH